MRATTSNKQEPLAENAEDDADKLPLWEQADLVNAIGFFFKAKLVGWKLFCQRWNAAPVALWEHGDYPGLDRIKRAWALVHGGLAFPTTADLVRWLNTVRPIGEPELTEAEIMTAERIADSLDAEFRACVRWWGG
jgi:hypothetical protein